MLRKLYLVTALAAALAFPTAALARGHHGGGGHHHGGWGHHHGGWGHHYGWRHHGGYGGGYGYGYHRRCRAWW